MDVLATDVADQVQALAGALEKAGAPGQLADLFQGIQDFVAASAGQGDALETGRLASGLYDRLLVRAAALARDGPGDGPGGWCLAVLGSQGRGEQLLATDQDTMLILPDGAGENGGVAAFAARLRDILQTAGLPPCPKGIMAAAPDWRKPLGQWFEAVDGAAERPDATGVLFVSLLADLRAVDGDVSLAAALAGHIRRRVVEAPLLVRVLAREAVRFAPTSHFFLHVPLGFFGFAHSPFDLKRLAVYPLVLGVKALALDVGLAETATVPRLIALARRGVLGRDLAMRLIGAFGGIQAVRLELQAKAYRSGAPVGNLAQLQELSAAARDGLREALRAVATLCAILEHHFGLAYLT
jgi:CBS domain-containing protein